MQHLTSTLRVLGPDVTDVLCRAFRPLPRPGTIVKKGSLSDRLFFIEAGFCMVRVSAGGRSRIRHIAAPGEFIMAVDSFEGGSPSQEEIIATSDAKIFFLERETFRTLLRKHPPLAELYQSMITVYLVSCQRRIADLLTLDARSYYEKLLGEKPEVMQSVPQYELADYMGIRPQSLSRIRSQIAGAS